MVRVATEVIVLSPVTPKCAGFVVSLLLLRRSAPGEIDNWRDGAAGRSRANAETRPFPRDGLTDRDHAGIPARGGLEQLDTDKRQELTGN